MIVITVESNTGSPPLNPYSYIWNIEFTPLPLSMNSNQVYLSSSDLVNCSAMKSSSCCSVRIPVARPTVPPWSCQIAL